MTYINHVVISIVLLTTATALSFLIVAVAIPNWRSVVVSLNMDTVLNGTEGLWTYCENHNECEKLNTDNTGLYAMVSDGVWLNSERTSVNFLGLSVMKVRSHLHGH